MASPSSPTATLTHRRLRVPSENIIMRRCQMKDEHGGVTVGSEISGGARNIFAADCRIAGSQ